MIARQLDHKPAPAGARVTPEQAAPARAGSGFAEGAHPLLGLQRAAGNRYVQRMMGQHRAGAGTPAPVSGSTLLTAAALLQLQRHHGNRYVQSLISQARANDAAPQSNKDDPPGAAVGPAGGAIDASLQGTIDAARGAGRTLDQKVGAQLGQALGADFGHVKLHTDKQADRLSRSLNASAFTTGSDIFFRANQYNPSTSQGKRLLAHELTHVVQQGANIRTTPQLRLTPANDPGERAADRVAGDVVRRGRAQPPAHLGRDQRVQPAAIVPQALLIQRKAFIGADPASATRAELENPWYGPMTHRADVVEIPDINDNMGTGERKVHTIVEDQKSRYFRDPNELYDYARRRTEDIGYVDREKTWVRLPAPFLVLGERHSGTTLLDLVEATGTERYVYEGGPARPSPYLHPGEEIAEGTGRHALEEILPKLVIGLVGVEEALQPELAALQRLPGWQGRVRGRRRTAARADPEAAKLRYEADLTVWSSEWEAEYKGAEARGWRKPGVGARMVSGSEIRNVLMTGAPDKPYAREAAEVALTRKALEELRTAARGNYDPITRFYTENQQIINKTIAQLAAGLPVHLTRMFLAIASGRFDLRGLIGLLTAASEREFTASGARDISTRQDYGRSYETGTAGQRMEELRDSYMLRRILAAKADEDRLAGLGDNHRKNLQGVLQQLDPSILVKRWTDFYADQYRRHPDRE